MTEAKQGAGAEVFAAASAALAATYLALSDARPDFAAQALATAEALYQEAVAMQPHANVTFEALLLPGNERPVDAEGPVLGVQDFGSTSVLDDMAFAAAWLAKATGKSIKHHNTMYAYPAVGHTTYSVKARQGLCVLVPQFGVVHSTISRSCPHWISPLLWLHCTYNPWLPYNVFAAGNFTLRDAANAYLTLHWEQEAAWTIASYYFPTHDNMAWPAAVLLMEDDGHNTNATSMAMHRQALSLLFRGWLAGKVSKLSLTLTYLLYFFATCRHGLVASQGHWCKLTL